MKKNLTTIDMNTIEQIRNNVDNGAINKIEGHYLLTEEDFKLLIEIAIGKHENNAEIFEGVVLEKLLKFGDFAYAYEAVLAIKRQDNTTSSEDVQQKKYKNFKISK